MSVNDTIAILSNAAAEAEAKFKNEEDKRKKLEEECGLLSSEIQKKAIEITQLKNENEELIIENDELKGQADSDKKLIEELTIFKQMHENLNYESLIEEKNKGDLEKSEMEKKYLDMKQLYESEQNKLLVIDKSFYNYKQESKAQIEQLKAEKEQLEKELNDITEELELTKKKLEDTEKELKNSLDVVTMLKLEGEKKKAEMEEIKTESYNKLEEIKSKMEKAGQSVFSQDKILNIIAENIHFFFEQEFHLSLTNIIETIFKNFLVYTQSIFSTSESGGKFIHDDENLYIYNLKDIYFFIYFYIFNLKKTKREVAAANNLISSNDFTEEIISEISNKLYEKNLIHQTNRDCQKTVNEYLGNLKKLGMNDEHIDRIKQLFNKKNGKYRVYLLNLIKSLVKKCADTINNSAIEMNNKILYDFNNYTGEEFSFYKNNLQIFCDKLNNQNLEILLNLLKYSNEPISRVHFQNNFNLELSEFNIQKILLNLMTYNSNILSFSFSKCENIKSNVLYYILFCVQNLKNIKILSFEACQLTDEQMKIISEGIKENKNIIALMLRKNNITSQGGIYISQYMNTNKNIRQLYLGDNKIKEKGLKSLVDSMSNINRNITNLDISNNGLTLEDFNNLIEYLNTNPTLNSLDLSGNKLDLKSSINLGATLSEIKTIKSLNMSNMGIISEFIPNLFRNLNVDDIALDDNTLEEVGLIMLNKGLEGNKNLKKLSLKNTRLSSIGLSSLLKMLDKADEFQELHIENNTIDDMTFGIMKTMVKSKQFKIFVSKRLMNQELFKDEEQIKDISNIILV
jgi:hypothetical protein